ncbi:hypothetical protein CIB48_g23 [Xylaria polymorpha]|nr:hypothetical protein CIB48_g23 [Xylaria polymorpha]
MESLKITSLDDWNVRSASTLLVAVVSPFLVTWLLTSLQSWRQVSIASQQAHGAKRPPTLPSAVPVIGHILQFMQDGHGFLSTAVYIVSGQETVAAFLKDPARGLIQTSRSLNIMEHAFGCPHDQVDLFRPQQDVELENQIHSALQGMLSGSRLEILAERYQAAVVSQVFEGDAKMTDEWTSLPDLCTFIEKNIFEAATRAVFGPNLVALNPTVSEDFWNFNRHVKSMFMGVPKWLSPASRKSRDKMTGNVKRWQRYAEENCNIDDIPEDVEWEPYYGSKSTRVRQQLLKKRGITDESARAAENLAFMWATNANSVPAACWFLLQSLTDPELKERVRKQLQAASIPIAKQEEGDEEAKPHLAFDIQKLISDDLLQSIYAEVLRLRVAVLIVRQPTHDQFSLNGWHMKQTETVSMSTRNELLDQDFWNAGTEQEPHPLDEFWAERFLVYPDDPRSGPLKEPKRRKAGSGSKAPYFSLDGCTWSWVPFGGGRNLCPGRHFAKREIMLTAAIFFSAYDIELLSDKMPSPDESVFGFGTMPPNSKVPCRIRRRQV